MYQRPIIATAYELEVTHLTHRRRLYIPTTLSSINGILSGDTQTEKVEAENQMNLLQDMIFEMKEGFQNALGELVKIQSKEEADANYSKKLQQQQQRQLDHLMETVGDIKHQLSSLTKSVEQIREEQKILKDNLEVVKCNNIDTSQDNKTHSDKGSGRISLTDDVSAHSEELYTNTSKLSPEAGDQTAMNRSNDDITAIACKSISLTQALSEECLKFSLSQSINDEEEDEEILRMSSYRQQNRHHVLNQTADGHLGLSDRAVIHDRNRLVGNAAQRQKAVMELADSERDYCNQIWSLLYNYLTPLQTAGLMCAEELDILFPPYLEQLYTEHYYICAGLQDKLIHWSHMTPVTDLLVRITDSCNSESLLSLYKEYTDDLPEALTCLRRAMAQSSELRLFLKAVKNSSCQSGDLMSLLLAPVQRIPQYLIHLQELSHYTHPTHTDYLHLQTLLHQFQDFVDQLNDELLNTFQEWGHEVHAGSDAVNKQAMGNRIRALNLHSLEDDSVTSARDLSKASRFSERLENLSYIAHQRQPWATPGHINARSQPDLTVYNSPNNLTAHPQIYTHMPRSQSALHAGTGDSGHDVATRQQGQKFKMNKKFPSPVSYRTIQQDHIYHSSSPWPRPSSAVDFPSQSYHHSQQFSKHSINTDHSEQSRNYQHQSPQSRPHTALGLHAMKSNKRPVVISRKNIRQSQPHVPTSNTPWAEPAACRTLPVQVRHQRAQMEVSDLLPAQCQHKWTSNIRAHCCDEENDTRASDTSGSHPHSQDQGFYKDHKLDAKNGDNVNDQSPRNNGLVYDSTSSTEFSSAKLTATATRSLHSAHQKTIGNEEGVENKASSFVTNPKISTLKERLSKSVTNHMMDNAKFKEHLRDTTDINKDVSSSNHSIKSDHGELRDKYNQHELLTPPIKNGFVSDSSNTSPPVEDNVFRERDESQSSVSNHVQTNTKHEQFISNVNDSQEVNGSEHFSEINRQFLLSLSNKSTSAGRTDLKKTSPINNKSKTGITNSKDFSGKNSYPQSSSCDSEIHSADLTVKSSRVLPHPPPRNSRTGSSHLQQTSAMRDISDKDKTAPTFHFKRHPQLFVSSPASSKDGVGVASDIPKSSVPLKYEPDLSYTLSSSRQTYSKSPSVSSHQSPIAPDPQFTSFTTSSVGATTHPQGAPVYTTGSSDGHTSKYGDHISYSYNHDFRPLDMSDLDVLDERKQERRKEDVNKIKEEGNVAQVENLAMVNDEHISTKKKTHFKASFKNLFTKKKGRVILADVEREVMMEISAANSTSLTATALKQSSYSQKEKKSNFCSSNFFKTCNPRTNSGEVFEIKTWKDQATSTSSPIRVCKKLNSFMKQDKLTKTSTDSRELNFDECKKLEHSFNHLKTGKKLLGMSAEKNNSQLGKIFDGNSDSMCSLGPGSSRKINLYSHEKSIFTKLFPVQQSHQSEIVMCRTADSGLKLHSNHVASLDKRMLSEYCLNQDIEKDTVESRKPISRDFDLLKCDPKMCNNCQHKTVIQNGNRDAVMNSSILENKVITQKSYGHQKESDQKKLQLPSHVLCQQCQIYKIRQTEQSDKISISNTADESVRKECVLDVPDNISSSFHEYSRNVIKNCSSHKNKNETTAHSVLFQGNILYKPLCEEQKHLLTENVMQLPHFNSLDSFKTRANALLLYETSKNNKINNIYLLPCQKKRQKMDKQQDKSKIASLSQVCEQSCSKNKQCHYLNQAVHIMPDCADGCTELTSWSESKRGQNVFPALVTSVGATTGFLCSGQAHRSESCHWLGTGNSLFTLASNDCNTKTSFSTSASRLSLPPQKLTDALERNHQSTDLFNMLSELKSVPAKSKERQDELLKATEMATSKSDLNEQVIETSLERETDCEDLGKCLALEDRESVEHWYRLYYDDEIDSFKNKKI